MFLVVLIYYLKSQVAVRRSLAILYRNIPPSCNCFQSPWQVEKNWTGVTTISVKAINMTVMCVQCLKQCQSILVSLVCALGWSKVSVKS